MSVAFEPLESALSRIASDSPLSAHVRPV
jgi:hypothetical protein